MLATSAMGRKPTGGGIKGGQQCGAANPRTESPEDNPIRLEDIAKTVYYAMGIDDLGATDTLGRRYNLFEEGKALTGSSVEPPDHLES